MYSFRGLIANIGVLTEARKMQDRKMTDQVTGVENAGLEYDGPNRKA